MSVNDHIPAHILSYIPALATSHPNPTRTQQHSAGPSQNSLRDPCTLHRILILASPQATSKTHKKDLTKSNPNNGKDRRICNRSIVFEFSKPDDDHVLVKFVVTLAHRYRAVASVRKGKKVIISSSPIKLSNLYKHTYQTFQERTPKFSIQNFFCPSNLANSILR